MALVLRKAVLPKNVSLLKCIKGRPLATAAHKKSPAPLSGALLRRNLKNEKKVLALAHSEIGQSKQLPAVHEDYENFKTAPLRFCVSCPNFIPESRMKPLIRVRHISPFRTKSICYGSVYRCTASLPIQAYSALNANLASCFLMPKVNQCTSKRHYSEKSGKACPCPFPCGPCGCSCGCGCLPGPCNTPPRCVQYITGYYYYPYGFWFCGPYHVSGTCIPCGPCGPCPPPSPPSCPPKPPCPCCICPATAAAAASVNATSPAGAATGCKCGYMPGTQITNPLSAVQRSGHGLRQPIGQQTDPSKTSNRSGISKFFPFNTVASMPNAQDRTLSKSHHTRDPKDPKKPTSTSLMSAFMLFPCNAKNCDSNKDYPSRLNSNGALSPLRKISKTITRTNTSQTKHFSTAQRPFSASPRINSQQTQAIESRNNITHYSTNTNAGSQVLGSCYHNSGTSTVSQIEKSHCSTRAYSDINSEKCVRDNVDAPQAQHGDSTKAFINWSMNSYKRNYDPVKSPSKCESRDNESGMIDRYDTKWNAFPSSSSAYDTKTRENPRLNRNINRNGTRDCPPLETAKVIMSQEQRDKPRVNPGAFDYSSFPNYKSPYPSPFTDIGFKAYDA